MRRRVLPALARPSSRGSQAQALEEVPRVHRRQSRVRRHRRVGLRDSSCSLPGRSSGRRRIRTSAPNNTLAVPSAYKAAVRAPLPRPSSRLWPAAKSTPSRAATPSARGNSIALLKKLNPTAVTSAMTDVAIQPIRNVRTVTPGARLRRTGARRGRPATSRPRQPRSYCRSWRVPRLPEKTIAPTAATQKWTPAQRSFFDSTIPAGFL